MTIREKIAARKAEQETGDGLKRGLWRMAWIIFAGYAIGTVIAVMLLSWKGII